MNQQETNNNITITKSYRKQTTAFIITNTFVGTKKLSDILASLAIAEINNAGTESEKIYKNPA